MRLFEIGKKIAGILIPTSAENQINALRPVVEKGERFMRLHKSQDWPVLQKQLQDLHDEAVQKLSNPNMTDENKRARLCNRLDLLREIRVEQIQIIAAGADAQRRIASLEEKEHVGRAS